MPHIFGVGELTTAIKDVVEAQFPFVFVRGQVSNLSRPGSGHLYFTLKDELAALGVVWFKNTRLAGTVGGERIDPLTGEVQPIDVQASWLQNGMEVLCAGRLTVYAPRGVYQLVAELVEDMGAGRLYLEFEALKQELSSKGYFALERKRPMPVHPTRLAVITAPTAAALQDFLRVGENRGFGCQLRLYPTLVQGDAAPAQIAKALRAAGRDGWAQAAVLVRGGGSIEDLWAFNTIEVATAIFESPIPVMTGVGHEVDVTIADLVADVRAATPSHAAQLLWVDRDQLMQQVDESEAALAKAARMWLAGKETRLSEAEQRLRWLSPGQRLERIEERLDVFLDRLRRIGRELTTSKTRAVENLENRLHQAFGMSSVIAKRTEVDALAKQLTFCARRWFDEKQMELERLEIRLAGLDPLEPLTRGYGLVRKLDSGKLVRSVKQVDMGESLSIRLADGGMEARVTSVEQDSNE
ncbi:exodeoxyribonuclease VII large subunit [Desulfovibrio inopinatus]|uniref:exodeoxyribonuclease VII large subunit n=1 Tax=Desulfovibrio inopinatus TaxID=102109 RepID=UPI00040CEF42|nr:exodeoxyribonuclease VII large subunit [Desulfovibrio inopinatus]